MSRTARDDALRLLAHRPRTVQEMRRRLKEKDHDPDTIDEVVEWLLDLEYLNDRAFARQFVAERIDRRPRGPFALVQELRRRGVERSLAEGTVRRVMEERGVDEAGLARAAAGRWLDRQSPSVRTALSEGGDEARSPRRRLYGYLERRGFRRSTARRILDEVEAELRSPDEDGRP